MSADSYWGRIHFLLEEPSAEAFMKEFLPRHFGAEFRYLVFQGKEDLLKNLPAVLAGYRGVPDDTALVVLVDEDRRDCRVLKKTLELRAANAGLSTPSRPSRDGRFRVLNRIAVEELEAWFFGDAEALRHAYPGVPASLSKKAAFRDPDRIQGGTAERLLAVLQKAGHFRSGLRKIELARSMGRVLDPRRNTSKSFQMFFEGVSKLAIPLDSRR